MNNIPITFLKDIKVTEHMTTGASLSLVLGIGIFLLLTVVITNDMDKDDIIKLAMISVVIGAIIVTFIKILPFERTDRQYVSKPLTVESISNTSEPDDYVVEVSDGKKSYIITDIKELDELEKGDRFYLRTTVESASETDEQKERYTLNQLKDSKAKIIKIKGE